MKRFPIKKFLLTVVLVAVFVACTLYGPVIEPDMTGFIFP